MTNLKLSSKMHVMIIVSVAIVAIGLAVGLICQFVAGGYFNYGSEYKSYKSVVVSYDIVNFTEDSVKEICEDEFKSAGVSYYAFTSAETDMGGEFVYKFSAGTDEAKLQSAAESINGTLNVYELSNAYYHEAGTLLGGGKVLSLGAIALASAVVFQFLYFLIRYKLTMALSALLADVHNFAIFVSLLAITRIPVGNAVLAFGALTVIMTMIGCCYLHDRMRKNLKDEAFAKLGADEQSDICARESLVPVSAAAVAFAVTAVILFVLLSISALSVAGVISAVLSALFAAVATVYGTAFFTPSIYSRFKRIGDEYKATHTKKTSKKS